MKKRILSILLAAVLLLSAVPLGLVEPAQAAESGAQLLTPASGTSGTGANGGTWKCSSAGDTLTLTDYDGYPIETDATTIRFSGTNTITVPLANLSSALSAYGLKLTSTKDTWVYGENGSSLNIVFTPSSAARDVSISGIDAEGPLFINTAGDITISAPYGSPYGIRARQGLDLSGTGALDITVKGSYLTNSSHWCAAYGIAAEKGAISLSGSGSKTIRVQSSATSLQIDSTPYAICHKGGTGSSGTATISVDTGALHIEMNNYGYGIYNMGSADSAYVNINNVPELSIEKADSAIATAYAAKVNVRNSKLRITNGSYAIRTPGGTVTMENAEVTAAVWGSSIRSTDAAVYADTLQVKGSSTVDMTATYGAVVYAGAVSVNLSSGSFTARTKQSNWPPISAPVTLGANTRLVTGVCSDADAGTYAGELVDGLYVTSFASVVSGSCGENLTWTLTPDGVLTISGTGAMTDYYNSGATPWCSVCSQIKSVIIKDGVTRIGNYAFSYCDALTGVTIPDSVKTIGDQVFKDCKALTSMTIPGSVTMIGDWAFDGCDALTDIYYGGYGIDWLSASGNYCGIPSGTTVHFKSGYGKGSCGDNVSWVLPLDGTLTISGTGAMEDYDIDDAPWYSFRSQVKSVVIEDGVTRIGISAFKNCDALTDVTIPGSITSIGEYAFSDCTGLTGVTIPDGVTQIGGSAFYDCTGLTSVSIPASVTSIGYSAFGSCGALTDVYYDSSMTDWVAAGGKNAGIVSANTTIHFKDDLYDKGSCGKNVEWALTLDGTLTISGTGEMSGYGVSYTNEDVVVFTYTPWEAYRSSIKSIVIKDGVTSIGRGVFAGCSNLTSVAMPSSVTSIGWCAFLSCSSLKSVHIPNGTTTIDAGAFSNCTGLTDVTIPGSVTSIENSAFSKCSSLTSVTIPNGVTSIGTAAFAGCTSLTSVTLPSSVTWIDSAFSDCSSLTDVYYGGYGMDWLEVYGHDQIPDSATVHFKEDLYGSGSCGENLTWTLDLDGVLTISGTGAMADYEWNGTPWAGVRSEIKSVVIGDGVTRIGDYAFQHCRALTGAAIPTSVTAIGDSAFYYCTSLASVTIPGGVSTIGDRAFAYCKALTGVTIPNGVTGIDNYAFAWCSALTSAVVPGSVSDIGAYAFYECGALTDVYYGGYGMDWLAACDGSTVVPGGTTVHFKDDLYGSGSCGISAQWAMDSDGTLTISGRGRISNYDPNYEASLTPAPWYAVRDYIQSVVIKDGITGIGNYAFYGCEELTSVAIPSGVTDIGDSAFAGCTSLNGVTIPAGVTAIRNETFYGCVSLTAIALPQGMTSIGRSAFRGCTSLTSVTIPDSVTSIDSHTFEGCTSLTNVTLPKSLTRLGGEVFRDCTSLTGMTVPEGVDCIYGSTFANCTSLTSVTLPSTVNWIGDNAFFNCVRLSSVTIPKRVCYIYQDAFRSCDSLADVYYGGTEADWAKITMEDGNGDLTHATLHCTAPAAPAAPVVTAGNSAVSGKPMLTWNAVDGATSYKVYRAAREDGTYGLLGSTSATSYTNTGAKEGVTYYYKVTAVNDIGESEPSNIVSGQVKAVTPKPAAPVVKIGNSATSGKPQLTWSAVTGAVSYNVYRAAEENGSYSLLGNVTVTNYTNTGAKAGVTYYYKVTAVNDSGESVYSNVVSGQVKSVTQQKPSAPVVKIGNSAASGKPMLTWNAVSGATSYKVYRATSQSGTYSLLGTVTATSYTNTGAKVGTTYYYKVTAVNSAGESAYSNIVSGQATVTTLTMGHSAASGKPQLTWKAVSGAASYKVYRATAKNGAYTVINTTSALTYTNTGAALGTTYYYKVEALNSAGKSMGFSVIVEGKVAPVLAVGYSSVSGKPQLTWKAVPGATGYQVYRSTQQNSGYSKINTTTSTSYVNTGAKVGTTYYYRIVAVKGTAASDFSNIVSARPSK